MSILAKLASARGIKGDVPNQELARDLAAGNNRAAIKELVENLSNSNKAIQSDCIKVLYEVGYIEPELIAEHISDFVELLSSKNNRLIWGGMIALSTIAHLKPDEILESRQIIQNAMEKGSVITVDAGIKALSRAASCGEPYNGILFPYLIDCLRDCRPKSVAQYSESISPAVTHSNKDQFVNVLNERKDELSPSQLKRVEKVLKRLA